MQIYEAALMVLEETGKPLHLRELVSLIEEKGYFSFGARQPERALGVALDRRSSNVKVKEPAEPILFYRAGPATYGLLKLADADTRKDLELEASVEKESELDSGLFYESDIHTWLFKNLEKNRLEALGYGPLVLVDPPKQGGDRIGRFNTGIVGEIDILCRTKSGDFVVIELKRDISDDRTVGQICRYWGYVKTEFAKQEQIVHGVILAQEVTDNLKYALKATNNNITARTLNFDISLSKEIR